MFREFVSAKQRLEDQIDRDIAQAWHVGRAYVLARGSKKGLPSLKEFMPKRVSGSHVKSKRETVAEHRTMLHVLSEQYGIPLRRRNRKNERG